MKHLRQIIVGIAVLVVMVLFTACAGVGTNGQTTLSGSIVSVDLQHNTLTLDVNGQTKTINNVPTAVLQALQGQAGKVYSITVTQNSDGSYTIVIGANGTPEITEGTGTPETGETSTPETTGPSEPGSVEFIGNVTSSGNGSITVSMPGGSSLTMSTNAQTELKDFNGSLPGVNTRVKAEATANTDGSFTATKIGSVDSSDDPNQATYQGVTTQAVGADHMIHFKVGNRSFSFQIASTADLSDYNGNAQSIARGATVKVTVEFSGTTGSVTKISNPNQ